MRKLSAFFIGKFIGISGTNGTLGTDSIKFGD
jgi:hypothetical protein